MAVADATISVPPQSPLAMLDHSSSNVSSPLSDVEDKDADPDVMDLDIRKRNSSPLSNANLEDDDGVSAAGTRSGSERNDDDSNLSDVDINDSEAETERLYDTPQKPSNIHNTTGATIEVSGRRDKPFEPSPSKLKQQIYAHGGAEEKGGAIRSLSHDGEIASDGSSESPIQTRLSRLANGRSPSGGKKGQGTRSEKLSTSAQDQSKGSVSSDRKRKRSPATDHSESDQPLRKRVGSVAAMDRKPGNGVEGEGVEEDGEGISIDLRSGDHSAPDDESGGTAKDNDEIDSELAEGSTLEGGKTRKSRKNGVKKRRSSDDEMDEKAEETLDDDPGEGAAEDEAIGPAEDDQHMDADVDEEAEAAHKNEEELEKKRAAFEQLQAIEKHFATFRDRLYEERLAQLNHEEAMLVGDNPTHPEYLAMMQCIDARRDEKLRIVELEYQFNMQTLTRWAVARRGQIHGQYFQSVRESREAVLEDLGRQWYHIQQQRRRHANTIPDYALRFPVSRVQRAKDAIAYNKEVSVLSGLAKYEGFPAAPCINGASVVEIEEDFEEIARARQGSHLPTSSAFPELSFNLGAAGKQYLSETPWANPNHPSHRQHPPQEPRTSSPFSGQAGGRFPHQQSTLFSSSTNSTIAAANVVNGESPVARIPSTTKDDASRLPKTVVSEAVPKREPIMSRT